MQDSPGRNLGWFAAGDPARDGIILADGRGDAVFLVIILNVAIADGRGTVVQDRQARGAQGLAFTALLKGTDRGTEVVGAKNACESVLDADAEDRKSVV